ncbi:ABC transporter permease [Ornatilinea apprima]|uniref:ABC transporter permease n=1 Tax=Ornatilinea apprima TaxID=1134406 RepID=A0A0P6XXD7_9CHLR|nr:ABC transporter permease [Ornatilinea apprima]KPL80549.1 ABC transporter permease [Ornatilinea apprima]
MSNLFTLPVLLGILYSGIRLATPYLYAAIGETFAQRSGVLNLGVEGIMLMGAYTGFLVAQKSGNLWLGLLAAAATGLLMGLMMAVVSVTLQAEQGISGIGLQLFGLGLSTLLYKKTLGGVESITGFQPIKIPLLGDLPYVGDVLFRHNLLVYGAFLLVPVAAFILNKTTFGLKVRAVGQNPQAADTLGVNVTRIRYTTVMIGGTLAGIAGASLSIALINLFQENMTNGMGFIAVALVYFGSWRPLGVLGGALLFSFVNALQLWVQVLGIPLPSDIAVMMPYLLTIFALAVSVNRTSKPAALTKPFQRGES